jgi:putative heme iron utilization protein
VDQLVSYSRAEFSGTLVGFDDYVSEFISTSRNSHFNANFASDMVLEDVTELYVVTVRVQIEARTQN